MPIAVTIKTHTHGTTTHTFHKTPANPHTGTPEKTAEQNAQAFRTAAHQLGHKILKVEKIT